MSTWDNVEKREVERSQNPLPPIPKVAPVSGVCICRSHLKNPAHLYDKSKGLIKIPRYEATVNCRLRMTLVNERLFAYILGT